ncbi:GSCOCG00003481001-RA-CDS [Cotesia congregata]|nr:GSCOCG00003481001-RA-CDS [Cotesia congregata]
MSYSPVIISMNSSKSTVPDPSVSISAMIPSRSELVNLSSRAAKISLSVAVVI